MKYDNRHAYTIEREREEAEVKNSAIMGEEAWHAVLSCGYPILHTYGKVCGFVMTDNRGNFALDTPDGLLVSIPTYNYQLKLMPSFELAERTNSLGIMD